jgi:hypothetical protein
LSLELGEGRRREFLSEGKRESTRKDPEVSKPLKLTEKGSQTNFNFLIVSLTVGLHRPNYNGKVIKMQIGKNMYFSETTKQLTFLTWKGRGYFFPNISENSILLIELFEEVNGSQLSAGICKIHLPFLNTH